MATQEDAFVKAMCLAAHTNPEFFSLKHGDFYFLDWRLTAWMALAMGDAISKLREYLNVEVAA